jgi:hypothetical protein
LPARPPPPPVGPPSGRAPARGRAPCGRERPPTPSSAPSAPPAPPPQPAARREPNKPATLADLAQLGVMTWQLDADAHEADPKLAAIRKVRGYSYTVGAARARACKCVRTR